MRICVAQQEAVPPTKAYKESQIHAAFSPHSIPSLTPYNHVLNHQIVHQQQVERKVESWSWNW
jgi:hypothetical protein